MELKIKKEMKKREAIKKINTMENELSSLYKEMNEVMKANSYMILRLKQLEEELEKSKLKIKELKQKN